MIKGVVKQLLLLCVVCAGVQTVSGQETFTDAVVATVNDKVITFFEVTKHSRFVDRFERSRIMNDDTITDKNRAMREALRKNRRSVVQQLVDQELIMAEFEAKGYYVPTKYIEQRLNDICVSESGGDWEKFRDLLSQTRTTLNEMRDRIRKQISVDLFINQEIERRITITPAEARAAYDADPGKHRVPSQVRLQMIVLDPKLDELKTKQVISDIRTALRQDKDFIELARTYSISGGKDKADDYDWLKFEDLADVLQEPVRSMDTGDADGPITIGDKQVFIRVADKKGGALQPFSEVRQDIRNDIYGERRAVRLEKLLTHLRQKAYIRTFD